MTTTSSALIGVNTTSDSLDGLLNGTTQFSANVTADTEEDQHVAITTYVLVPLGVLTLIALLAGLVLWLIRKARLDKLRHHLMPVYSFDPAEEGEDWEAELLEDGMTHQPSMPGRGPLLSDQPKLAFSGGM